MPLKIDWLAFDAGDPKALARFWLEALDDYVLEYEDDEGDEVAISSKGGDAWAILFLRVPDKKAVKNRLHLDLRPKDQDAEVERLLALGAKRVDVGQSEDVTWIVMADPEDNEFCVLRALSPEEEKERAETTSTVV